MSDHVDITRTFHDLSDADMADIEKASALMKYGWGGGFGWDEVLRSQRVLLISEAGVGKTHECKAQMARLRACGAAAFFLELGTLATTAPIDMLCPDEVARFEIWLGSQEETATFFLDSIDELKLTQGNFKLALTRFSRALAGQLARARIIITTRPVPFERELIQAYLPIPRPVQTAATASDFADKVLEGNKAEDTLSDSTEPKAWRNIGLMPLSREQQRQLAVGQNITDPDALLDDIHARDAGEFAGRPQDLIELCADWRDHHRIRSHRQQVCANVEVKLKPRADREERAGLSHDDAIEGASRLALAALLTRKLTLRHSAASDLVSASEPALDVSKILVDWQPAAQDTLLQRALFGFASYGRVRFHHRSVVEFLAAKRLDVLISSRGAPIKAIKRLLFAETAQGAIVVRPSMRPVAAWLASWHATVFDDLVRVDPTVLLDHGDPQVLSSAQRSRALEAYVDRYGRGGWRGLQTPAVQVHRFASPELAGAVAGLWDRSIENSEVRELLLRLIAAGRMTACADLAHAVALRGDAPMHERILAINALISLNDARLDALSASIETDVSRWPAAVARRAMVELFPKHMPVERLKRIADRAPGDRNALGEYKYRLRHEIAAAPLEAAYLDGIREALSDLISAGLEWNEAQFPHLRTSRFDLLPALTAACFRQAAEGVRTDAWIQSSLLVIRTSKREYGDEQPVKQLRETISALPAEARERAFWEEAALLNRVRPMKDVYHRVYELTHETGISLGDETDGAWVRRRLTDTTQPLEQREMMLWAELVFLNRGIVDHRTLLEQLKLLVADAPHLVAIIDERLKPREETEQMRRWQTESAKQKWRKEQRAAKAHASWVAFWQEIVRDPEAVFHPDRAHATAWHLWRAMERSGPRSREAGWNRQLIEHHFGKEVADRLRIAMMAAWRKDMPSLASERPEGEKNAYLVNWQFGLAGIVAEAEDINWAKRLTLAEAELACRYAPIQLNGFPSWLEGLAVEHPAAIDRVLGEELSRSLLEAAGLNDYSIALQDVGYASAILAKLFVPRVREWLSMCDPKGDASTNHHFSWHMRQAIWILMKNGSEDDRRFVEAEAVRRLVENLDDTSAELWLPALLHLNASVGVELLELRLSGVEITKLGRGAQLFGNLFERNGNYSVDLGGAGFTPNVLLRLLRLAYTHIRREDDEMHEGSYTPGPRDDAERARSAVLSALLSASGPEGWNAKLEMAGDPLFGHLRDRTRAVAEGKAAEEADSTSLTEADCVALDRNGEAPPSTRDAMFALMRDRLEDIDDLLLQDVSPRAAWALIKDEHVMRRELTRVLRDAARGSYTADQEAVTADEKETDIRLRSINSGQQATIELKLGDQGWSGRDLFRTVREQLLAKYMAAEECRSGCLLITLAADKKWQHPHTGNRIDFVELIDLLNEECDAISRELGGMAKLMTKGLDLRPRLGREG
ncbi:hypothetical protein [Methylobacterium iners]|uniref:hypothetical protein n=1 Tax=Methylobacterium iners TaxID=418707 RepID=UPI001EE34B20|nr:hypothetical protein [Methylobacterium iners]